MQVRHRCLVLALCGFLAGCGQSDTPLAESQPAAAPATATAVHGPVTTNMQFVEGYWRGFKLAEQTGKPMLVFFTASWCTYCHQMAAEVFTQPGIIEISERFVCVRVDADAEPTICQQFRVQGFPTVQFLSPRGVPLNRVTGKQPAASFAMEMQTALQATARREQYRRDALTR
ncbi:MAG: thioredoxin family protein [Pirellulales bacterium]|nr:thioredoxin family protein [Pirellulales bacterium]